jgi:flagellin
VADGAYSKINDILVRMKNLATQAASGQTENLSTVNNEFQALKDEIDRIAGSTKYGEKSLVDGSQQANGVTFQVGTGTTSSDTINLKLKGVETADLALTSLNIETGASAAMDAIDDALTSINSYMGEVGAYQNRLQYTMENLAISIENFSASESTIRDVDMAAEVMQFTKNQILQQTSMAMMAQANQAPQQITTLLR